MTEPREVATEHRKTEHRKTITATVAALLLGVSLITGTPTADAAPRSDCSRVDPATLKERQSRLKVYCYPDSAVIVDEFNFGGKDVRVLPRKGRVKPYRGDLALCQAMRTRGDGVACVYRRGNAVLVRLVVP